MRSTNQIILCLVVVLLIEILLLQPSHYPQTAQSVIANPQTIPVEITSYGGIILQTRINNSQPMSFWLDSGATAPFVVGLNKATTLGLRLQGHVSRAGGAGPNT